MSILKNGTEITSLELWEEHAGPKSKHQWADGRSAKESARAWLAGGGVSLPEEISLALLKHEAFGQVLNWDAEPEMKLPFDRFRGETRNSDMVVRAEDAHGRYLIAVEAKSDEPFAETVDRTLLSAIKRRTDNPASNGVRRIKQLAAAVLGARRNGEPALRHIRYQLLTACAGAVCYAERQGYPRALVLIHEIVSNQTSDVYHKRNAADLNLFVTRLSHGSTSEIPSGSIGGPFTLPGAPLMSGGVELYIGKVSRNLRS